MDLVLCYGRAHGRFVSGHTSTFVKFIERRRQYVTYRTIEAFRVCRPHIVAVYMMTFLLWVAILTFLCHDLHEELLKLISLW